MGSSKEYNQKYYLKNKEKILKYSKDYYTNNKENVSIRHKAYNEKNKEHLKELHDLRYSKNKEALLLKAKKQYCKNPKQAFEKRLLLSAKHRAKRTGLDFSLDLEDIIIPEFCLYLGIPLTKIVGNGRLIGNASIDRIDSSKGYTKDNIQIISWKANMMKQDVSVEQLITFAKGVLKAHDS